MRVWVFGSIEAGGTKFVCAVGDDELNIIERASFPTMNPEETMKVVIGFFRKYQRDLESIGIGSFGPIDIHRESPTYGYITSTPKLAWQNFDFVGTLKKILRYQLHGQQMSMLLVMESLLPATAKDFRVLFIIR